MKRQTNYHALMRLLVCWLIGISSLWSYAATEVTIGDWKYELDDATKEATVTGWVSENVTSVTIPEKVSYEASEYSVTTIGKYAFYRYSGLTSLTIPNSVTSIDNFAFNGCSGLKNLTIEDGEKELSLGSNGTWIGLFYDCPLESVYLGRNLSYETSQTYRNSPFSSKTKLTSLTLGNSVTTIGQDAFRGCIGLTSLTIGNSVITIGESAFEGCRGLASLTIGNSVTTIGEDAFSGCSGLTVLTIPNSVTSIDNYAFNGCSGIRSLVIEDGEKELSFGGSYVFRDCSLEIVHLGRNLNYNSPPFNSKPTLTSLTIGNSVTTIGEYAFRGCGGLTSLTIPDSVILIGKDAFYGCSGLTSLTIGNSVTTIGEDAFSGCSGLTSLTIPDSVILIGKDAFRGCSGLTSLIIGNSVTTIGESAFSGCSGLVSLTIPNSVTSVGNSVFNGCIGLKNLTIEDGENELSLGYNSYSSTGKGLFYDCPLESVYLGRTLSYVTSPNYGYSPFYSKTTLTSLTIGNSVTSIGYCTFSGCSGLTSLTIGNSVTTIGLDAFRGCTGLTSLTIPNSVTSIGNYAFDGCIGLKNLTIEDGEKELSLGYNSSSSSSTGQGLFYDCPLESVYLGRNLSYETSKYYGYSPFYFKPTLTSLTIGNSVTSIGNYAFSGCSGLTEVTIPNSVTTIGQDVFRDCSGLTSLTIPNSVTSIGSSAFNGCIGLKNLTIDDGEKELSLGYNSYSSSSIGKGLFYDCPLESVYLGRNLSYDATSRYGYSPFYSKATLTSLTIGNSVTTIGSSAFSDCSNITAIKTYSYVIKGIENCGLPKTTDVSILMEGAFDDKVWSTNILCFDKVLVEKEGNKYAFVTAPEFFEFTNCLASNASYFLVQLDKDCIVKDPRNYEYSYFKGENISDRLSSEEGFSFIPSEHHAENVFTCIDDGIELSKDIILSSAGTLFDKVGLQDIEKVDKLKVTGDLNGTDIMTINRMKSLKWLDISDANIVAGGTTYRENLKTENDVIGSYFFNDIELKVLKLSNSANIIDQKAFKGMNSLVIVEIGDNTREIRESAFSGCSKIFELAIPASVTSIGNSAFNGCIGLKNLRIEDGEKELSLGYNSYSSSSIGKGLFYDCQLESVYLGRTLSYDATSKYGLSPFYSKTTLTSLIIGNSVTTIGEYAFCNCTGLTDVTIPTSVTSIGSSAFEGCSGLTSLTIPTSVTLIGSSAFEGCSGLTSLTIGNSVTTIGEYAFCNCTGLTDVTIPTSVTSIGSSAFEGCSGLTSLTIPTSVTSIGSSAFEGCSGLTSLTIGNSVTSIGNSAFNGCIGLKNLRIEDGEKELSLGYNSYSSHGGEGLFYGCPLESVYLGRNLNYSSGSDYGYSPFYSMIKLISLIIGNSVTSIGEFAFSGCFALESVILSNNLTEIQTSAFQNSGLKAIEIPNSVTSLGSSAFSGCSALESAILSNTLTEIQTSAFQNSGLKAIEIPNSVTSLGSSAFSGCSALESAILSNNLIEIQTSAFQNSGLKAIEIPNSVTSLGSSAFSGCTTLESAILSNNLTEIQTSTFQNTGLKEIEIPYKVSSIAMNAFRGCQQLEKVILPASLTKAGSYAFGECPAIMQVYSLNTTPPVIESSTFDSEVEEKASLHVKKGSMVHYWLDPVWKEFKNMNEDILCLETIPAATYGDGEIDLARYAPEGVKLRYETSNSDVVEINGNIMRIVGAGEATVGAILDEEQGTPMELMGQMRQFVVDKADLEITVAEIVIEAGQPLPDFSYLAKGLQYDDTIDDIEELPEPVCDVDEYSPIGEYPVYFTEGYDRNYNIATKESKVIVGTPSGVENGSEEMIDNDSEVEVYTLNGMFIYRGPRKEAQLERGVYIVRQGKMTAKIIVR